METWGVGFYEIVGSGVTGPGGRKGGGGEQGQGGSEGEEEDW